jgi:hypothetical protein
MMTTDDLPRDCDGSGFFELWKLWGDQLLQSLAETDFCRHTAETYLWNVQLFLVKSLNSKTRSFEDFGGFNHGNP